MGHVVTVRPIIAVTCLSFEARVASGPGVSVLCCTAQRYVDKLVALLPPATASVLDIGWGTGAMAGRLHALGYEVEISPPGSPIIYFRWYFS